MRTVWYAVAPVAGWILLVLVPFEGSALLEFIGVVGLQAWMLQTYDALQG